MPTLAPSHTLTRHTFSPISHCRTLPHATASLAGDRKFAKSGGGGALKLDMRCVLALDCIRLTHEHCSIVIVAAVCMSVRL